MWSFYKNIIGGFQTLAKLKYQKHNLFYSINRNLVGKVLTPSTTLVKTVLKHDGLILLLFHADWCDQCKEFVPDVEELLDDYNDIELYLVNIENDRLTTEAFHINLIPALMGFRDGNMVLYKYGNLDVNLIADAIDRVI